MEIIVAVGALISSILALTAASLFIYFSLIQTRDSIITFRRRRERLFSAQEFGKSESHLSLFNSVIERNETCVEANFREGGKMAPFTGEEITALHVAVESGELAMVNLILKGINDPEEIKKSVNFKDRSGYTPVHLAAFLGESAILGLLLKNGGEANLKTNQKCTPLHKAAFADDISAAELLICGYHVNVNSESVTGLRPIHNAVWAKNLAMVHFLLINSADPEDSNRYGHRPLHVAARQGDCEIIHTLLANGAFVDSKTFFGRTPLHRAAKYNKKEAFELLLKSGADISISDIDGNTPLHLAADRGSAEVLNFVGNAVNNPSQFKHIDTSALIDAIFCENNSGLTVIGVARSKGYSTVSKNLLFCTPTRRTMVS